MSRPRRIGSLPAIALLSLLVAGPAPASEGMWPPSSVRLLDWDALRGGGATITPDTIWNKKDGGLAQAIVSVGDCSGAFVGRSGLILTARACVAGDTVPPVTRSGSRIEGVTLAWAAPAQKESFALLRAPVKPDHWLKLAADPPRAGDAVFVLGMPARTERWLPASALERDIEFVHPRRAELLTGWLEILRAEAQRDDRTARLLAPDIGRAQRNLDRALGRLEGLRRSGALEKARRQELEIRDWIALDPVRRGNHAALMSELDNAVTLNDATREKDVLLRYMLAACSGLARALDPKASITPGAFDQVTDQKVQQWFVRRALALPQEQRIAGLEPAATGEPSAARLAPVIAPERDAWRAREKERDEAFAKLQPAWIKLLTAWRRGRFYPDADGTLRVSAGLASFESPCAGVAGGCFLSDADTAAGSAGSPVLNGKGDLIGIDVARVGGDAACEDAYSAEHTRDVILGIGTILARLESDPAGKGLLRELR